MNIIPLFVAISLAGAFLISILGKRIKTFPDIFSNLITFSLFCLSLLSIFLVKTNGVIVYKVGGWTPPIGISMVLDGLSSFMLVTVNLIAFLVTLYSVNYMEKFTAKWKFYTLFLLMLAGMNGVIISGDMFNLFVFLEIASVASYALVAYGTEREELEAAFKYIVMGTLGSFFILFGIAIMYSYTSTLNMADMSLTLSKIGLGKIGLLVSVFFIMGFGLKAAIAPFHAWLPDAHPSAPAPISAMLSGVLIKVLGLYAIMRVFFNVLGTSSVLLNIFIALGTISMIVGGLLAIGQGDIKRMFAYSSISQIGYILLALGIGTPLAILGGLLHLINHSVFKSLLFLNSGAIEYSTGTRKLNEMSGLNSKMPVTGITSTIGSMSISGMPPFNGFWSKLIIIIAAVKANHFIAATLCALVSILTLAYYLKFLRNTFFGPLNEKWANLKEVPLFMKTSMIVLALICVLGGVLLVPDVSKDFLGKARDVLVAEKAYGQKVTESVSK